MSVQVYSKSSCVQCNATYRALDKEGIEYSVIDLEGDPHRRERSAGARLQPGPGRHCR